MRPPSADTVLFWLGCLAAGFEGTCFALALMDGRTERYALVKDFQPMAAALLVFLAAGIAYRAQMAKTWHDRDARIADRGATTDAFLVRVHNTLRRAFFMQENILLLRGKRGEDFRQYAAIMAKSSKELASSIDEILEDSRKLLSDMASEKLDDIVEIIKQLHDTRGYIDYVPTLIQQLESNNTFEIELFCHEIKLNVTDAAKRCPGISVESWRRERDENRERMRQMRLRKGQPDPPDQVTR